MIVPLSGKAGRQSNVSPSKVEPGFSGPSIACSTSAPLQFLLRTALLNTFLIHKPSRPASVSPDAHRSRALLRISEEVGFISGGVAQDVFVFACCIRKLSRAYGFE